jgi:hypothetical protein
VNEKGEMIVFSKNNNKKKSCLVWGNSIKFKILIIFPNTFHLSLEKKKTTSKYKSFNGLIFAITESKHTYIKMLKLWNSYQSSVCIPSVAL